MSLVRFGYRWSCWRGFTGNLGMIWPALTRGVRNLIRWAPVIWHDRDWDRDYALALLERKLRFMAEHLDDFGHHVGSDRDANRMRICAEICRRIRADRYGYELGETPADLGRSYFEGLRAQLAAAGAERDMAYLGHMLGKYMLGWWN